MTEQSSTDSAATRIGLDDAYAVDGPEDNRKLYASWAETYESVFLAENDYEYHLHVAAAFCGGENLRNGLDGPVLDVGCGTGVVGAELARLGVGVIDGIDISPEMLAKAAAKMHEGRATYRQLFEADLTGRLDLGSDAYAGIVSAGAFTHGHLGPEPAGSTSSCDPSTAARIPTTPTAGHASPSSPWCEPRFLHQDA
ncbi:class I SAM-dependent methyltransferase [Candidatus Poriferisodalis multihospitum]|uniref:class I SAM-dependent DNA methyltransferase n=1 Tax=Candidatus Poriferisodalis multihospitum TaxID=2983191 RepID=UPI002B261064|nr:class I SAM-dependent methyltransferase [Candidatus Poriferisodalis multihospitum]